jgi:DNA gyrase/topoisomerase IV, subunit A/Intein splicing domain/HNH endonuclease
MVTKSTTKKTKGPAGSLVPAADKHVKLEALRDFGKRNMTTYAIAVNLDRSVPDLYDGMKPVQRRILWAVSQQTRNEFTKSARTVGDVLGKYHPHGDCLGGETLVYTLDGKMTRIDEMLGKGKKWVLAYDEKNRTLVPALAHSWRIGQHAKKTYRLELSDGSYVEATGNHQFYIRADGWVKTENLVMGDEITGGALVKEGYLKFKSSCLPSGAVHSLVSAHTNGDGEDGEVVHHDNENRWDNRPKNLKLIDRADHHAEHLDNAIVGLRNGNRTMKSRRYRKAIRRKNSALMSAHNEWLWLIKAIKIAKAVLDGDGELNAVTYERYRGDVYNGTKWATLVERGITPMELIRLTNEWVLPTDDAKGHTAHLRETKTENTEAHSTVDAVDGANLRRFMQVIRRLRHTPEFSNLSWSDYEQERQIIARRGKGYGNIHKRNYPKKETLQNFFGKKSIAFLFKKASPRHGLFITGIEVLRHEDRKPMYDFTVDGYENMLVATKDNAEVATLVVAHNSSVYGAMVTMTHMPTPAIQGKGNWGNMIDGAAAYRYTNARLSQYGYSFFLSDYIHKDVTTFVPNYDDKDVEPVTLPAQLPNAIINGGDGIGVGITTSLPTFTPDSVIDILERLLKGEKLQSSDFAKTLKYAHKWGGHLVNTKENKLAWLKMFRESETNVKFESTIQLDRDRKKMVIDDWPPGTNLQKFIDKVRAMPETQRCYNSKGSATLTIECKPAYNYVQFDKYVEKVQAATRQSCSFKINVTKREAQTVDGVTTFETKFLALSVPKLIMQWLRMRLELEQKSLAYRVAKQEAAINYSKLLIFVSSKLETLFKALRSSDPDAFLVKHLKLTPEQAKQVLDLPTRRWSKMDQQEINAKLKEQQKFLGQLQTWQKRPKSKVLLDLADVRAFIEKDRNFKDAKDNEKLVVV